MGNAQFHYRYYDCFYKSVVFKMNCKINAKHPVTLNVFLDGLREVDGNAFYIGTYMAPILLARATTHFLIKIEKKRRKFANCRKLREEQEKQRQWKMKFGDVLEDILLQYPHGKRYKKLKRAWNEQFN